LEFEIEAVVKDNGIGFDQNEASQIFDTFSRLNSKDKYEGTVPGLSLCKKIVERNNGTIETQSVAVRGRALSLLYL